MGDEKIKEIIEAAEKRRATRTANLTKSDIIEIANELDIGKDDVSHAIVHLAATRTEQPITVESDDKELVLVSRSVGLRWPLLVRLAVALGGEAFISGLMIREAGRNILMAAAGFPIAMLGVWYLYRCLALSVEKTTLTLGDVCRLRIHSLPLVGRDVSCELSRFDVRPPEIATHEDSGFQIAPMYWLPIMVSGRRFNIGAGQSKSDLAAAYERVLEWTNAQRTDAARR